MNAIVRVKSFINARLPVQWQGRPYVWLYLVLAAIAVSAIGNAVAARLRTGDLVTVGVRLDRRGCVLTSTRKGIGLGDCLVAVAGHSVRDGLAVQARLLELGAGQVIELELLGAHGSRRAATVRSMPYTADGFMLAGGLVWFAVALGILWFKPVHGEALVLFVFGICEAVNEITAAINVGLLPDTSWSEFWAFGVARWGLVGSPFAFGLLLPYPLKAARRWPVTDWVLGLALLVGVVHGLARIGGWSVEPVFFSIWGGSLVAALIFVAGCMVWRQRTPQARKAASFNRLVVVALVSCVPNVAMIVADQFPGVAVPFWVRGGVSFLNTGVAAIIVYSILALDVLAIDKTVARVAAYGGTVLLVGFAYVTGVVLLPAMLAPEVLVDRPLLLGLAVCVNVVLLLLVSQILKRYVNRYFRRVRLTFEVKVTALNEVFDVLATQGLHQSRRYLEKVLTEVLEVQRVQLLEPGERQGSWRLAEQTEACSQKDKTPAEISQEGFPRLLQFEYGERTMAAVALGRPLSSRSHGSRRDEKHLLDTLQRGASLALGFAHTKRRIGKYKILGYLGAGGMGAVYLGARTGLTGSLEKLAIKQLLPTKDSGPQAIEQFLAEGETAKQLVHPNIIRTDEVGRADEGLFIAMEHMDGCDGRHLVNGLLKESRLLDVDCAVHMVTEVCHALAYAHAADPRSDRPALLHRDVTPDNLLISVDGEVKLADFGIAALAKSKSYDRRGKPAYTAPEILQGALPTPASDVFAAGVVLYELTLGEHPFRRRTAEATRRAIVKGNWIPLSSLRPEVPTTLEDLVSMAMQVDPAKRFSSAEQMGEALRATYPTSGPVAAQKLGALAIRFGAVARKGLRTHTMETGSAPQARRTADAQVVSSVL